jgi:DNA-binding phage protein
MPEIRTFDVKKFRDNSKIIAKYLNDALANDDPAFTTRRLATSRAPTEWRTFPNRRT